MASVLLNKILRSIDLIWCCCKNESITSRVPEPDSRETNGKSFNFFNAIAFSLTLVFAALVTNTISSFKNLVYDNLLLLVLPTT